MDSELARAVAVAVVTVLAVVGVGTIAGMVALSRRRRRDDAASREGLRRLETEAGVALVRLDDAVAEAEAELGFAVAQFGEERTRGFASALEEARVVLRDAFALRQRLDDAEPDSDRERASWSRRIASRCDEARTALEEQSRGFTRLRSAEADAPARLERIRRSLEAVERRAEAHPRLLHDLAQRYGTDATASLVIAADEVRRAVADASAVADDAEAGLDGPVTAVTDRIAESEALARRATDAADRVDGLAAALDAAAVRREEVERRTEADLEEARRARDHAPDAETAGAINDAIADVEDALRAGGADPIAATDHLADVVADLDHALASARSQAQRLEHARAALDTTVRTTRDAIAGVRALVESARGQVGPDARTRLAEAERELEVAERTPDPVEALDIARRAATHARDADALARYRMQ
ncbi:hypothetical protein CLV46_2484 [Diaminobutyricimonas aerilata]|uniref:Uncharacterized protein n=1 Tax=Diaminobutyricimonas aerilata TaxID=1162967 RepID=A0A2M9CLZ1_9MICO|nr:hypothetical protein [Diaminobutyricimonas aerilata]PJJ72906.1 hypothetical protein CLV46_2484 [Diaminobutyricimonas aerilata]